MKKLIRKIKHWFWFTFLATEEQKCAWDRMMYGTSITKAGKRIDPEKFYVPPKELT